MTKTIRYIINALYNILFWLASLLSLTIITCSIISEWCFAHFDVSIDALLFTLKTPKIGANTTVVKTVFIECLPKLIPCWCAIIAFTICAVLIMRKRKFWATRLIQISEVIFAVVLCVSFYYNVRDEKAVVEFLNRKAEDTFFYEKNYIEPSEVSIQSNSDTHTNNLILIYLESAESKYKYIDNDSGTIVDLIPILTNYANKNISFSNSDEVGGFYSPYGTDWTMGALFASSSGIPFSFPVDGNDMMERTSFANGVITLGDILNEKGYYQEFMCGSDFSYGGRRLFYETHGGYNIYDFFTAFPGAWEEYNIGWWGFEDEKLFSYAKQELLRLSSMDSPFNFTMLTVDTHFGDGITDGYICRLCENKYEDRYANVISCMDKQVGSFLDWITKQEFYSNTTVVIIGDHPFMGTSLNLENNEDKTVYNCFINPKKTPINTKNRVATTLDLFPTILSSLGFSIEGNKLALGVDLFSDEETLAEKYGLETLNKELGHYSQYYIDHFE